ncbi:MAG TPA: ribonuclease P protein component [Usitatibacteraceae bacterium]|nr:ribonuclease P protein component [Usitatibacteraceae bacterium]
MARGARKEGFSRRNRFVGRGSFTAALRSPRKFRGPGTVLHVATGRPGESRLGLVTPKRLTRRSVDRNRMKRLAREAFRRHEVKTAGLDLVLAPRQPFSRAGENAWLTEVQDLFCRAGGNR